jgi:hypothetical protein
MAATEQFFKKILPWQNFARRGEGRVMRLGRATESKGQKIGAKINILNKNLVFCIKKNK